jgi:colanic acid biosynthesis glycosyl transferase WcaI
MRLTIVNQFYLPDISPTAHLAASLAEHRAELGDEVTVVTGRAAYAKVSADTVETDQSKPHVCHIWTPGFGKATLLGRILDYGVFYLLTALRVLTLPRQDVIISLTTPPFIAWVAVLHRLLHRRTRLILWNMDCYPEVAERAGVIKVGSLLGRTMQVLNRALFRRLDRLVCLDAAMLSLLQSRYTPRRRSLPATVIPNWEGAAFFSQHANPKSWPEMGACGLRGRFVVLYSGNMGYGHRFDTVIDAAEALQEEPVTFLFVGGGSQAKVIQQAKQQRSLPNIVINGYVSRERIRDLMAAADCALITLRDEMLGVMSPSKLHANLAMRLPVIYVGPERSNVDEAIKRFDCGVSLRHGDVASLVDFVRTSMAEPRRLADLGRRARLAFEQQYCDRHTLPQFDAVIDQLRLESRGLDLQRPGKRAA